jgi:glucose-6-phosphate 1-epimerase
MKSIALFTPSARAELFLQGAHLARYEMNGKPVLFLSKRAEFAPGKAIRGGIPVCFPWFGPHADDPRLPSHGFARTAEWELLESREGFAALRLESNEATHALWPHDFQAIYRIQLLEQGLRLDFRVHNTGTSDFVFETALHTYFAVSDARQVSVEGLDGKTYLDQADGNRRKLQQGTITFEGETDRLYVDSGGPVRLREGGNTIRIINRDGVRSTVVWNPWTDKARSLKDLGEDQWPGFVCIESGCAADDAVTLEAGESWTLVVEYLVEQG